MRRRNRRFSLWLDDYEFAFLAENARKAGFKKEQYIRKLIMQREIQPRPPDEYTKLLRELSAIGNNINQLAYKANGLGVIHLAEVRRMRESFEKIYAEVKHG